MAKLEKVVAKTEVELPFQGKLFGLWLAVSVAFSIVGILIMEIPKIGGMGLIIIAVVYFIPTLLAFDVFQSYNKYLNIPKLQHPKRIFILIINLLFGGFIIGWLVALYMALAPWKVLAERVEYISVE